MKIKALLLDMDGVLIDSEKIYYDRKVDFLKSLGITLSHDYFIETLGKPMQGFFEAVISEVPGYSVTQLTNLYQEWKKSFPFDYTGLLEKSFLKLYEYLKEQNIVVSVVTSSEMPMAKPALEHNDIFSHVDLLITGDMVESKKPAPDIYQLAMDRLKLQPEQCLVVEDSVVGIQSAKAAGCTVLARVHSEYEIDTSLADGVVHSLIEVKDLLESGSI